MGLGRNILFSFCIALLPARAGAETVSNKTYSYFPVGGKTAAELDAALARSGPYMKETGMHHPGATQMKFGASVTYESTSESCRVKSAIINVQTKIILPRWTNRKHASRSLGVIWDTLSRDIKRHEERHAEIARQYGRKIEKSIIDLRPRPRCEQLRTEVNQISERILKAHYADQARFDRSEAASFERRMERMLRFKTEALSSGG